MIYDRSRIVKFNPYISGIPLELTFAWNDKYSGLFTSLRVSRKTVPLNGALIELIASFDNGLTYSVVSSTQSSHLDEAGCSLTAQALVGIGFPVGSESTNIGFRISSEENFTPDYTLKVD